MFEYAVAFVSVDVSVDRGWSVVAGDDTTAGTGQGALGLLVVLAVPGGLVNVVEVGDHDRFIFGQP